MRLKDDSLSRNWSETCGRRSYLMDSDMGESISMVLVGKHL